MTGDLGSDTRLSAQAGDGDDAREDAADLGARRVAELGGVGEEGAVFGVQDEDGEVGVGGGEFGEEFLVEGVVDGFPEGGAAGDGCVDVGWV